METDLQANIVTVVPQRDVAFPLRSVPDAIARSGFRPGRMWLEAHGAPAPAEGGAAGFLIRGWPSALRVEAGRTVPTGVLSAEILADGSLRPQ